MNGLARLDLRPLVRRTRLGSYPAAETDAGEDVDALHRCAADEEDPGRLEDGEELPHGGLADGLARLEPPQGGDAETGLLRQPRLVPPEQLPRRLHEGLVVDRHEPFCLRLKREGKAFREAWSSAGAPPVQREAGAPSKRRADTRRISPSATSLQTGPADAHRNRSRRKS